MPDKPQIFTFSYEKNNIEYIIYVPIIDLPNYSEYMLNENIEYDEHDLLLDGLFNYNPVNYKKHIINYDHIHDYDSCYNLYFHTETGVVLEYIDNHFKVFGKCDGCHNYIEHEHNSNSRINKLNYLIIHSNTYINSLISKE